MKINVNALRSILINILVRKGFSSEQAEIIANEYWESEISGKKTHGVAKFLKELQFLTERNGEPKIILDKGAVVLLDGNKEIGQLAAKYCIELLIKRTRQYGTAIIGINNIQRYGALGFWVRQIAKKDLIGIITNSCEPATTVFGGISPILGTNPIAVSIPTSKDPIILDMATSKASMSFLLYSVFYKKSLPRKTFLDSEGEYTQDPSKVKAVENFGEYKGYGLSLIFQILSGSLIKAKMGHQINSMYDIGYYFQAIDPSIFQDIKSFKRQNDQLIKEIKASERKPDVKQIFIPGEKSKIIKEKILKDESIKIPDKLFNLLNKQINEKH
ncbi:Ldh family oxidoreductase [Candidatus Parcubacteria bacterium]|nr:MAG: Ldh family oxidoreductase [Candidatus Parcubacteria bacterium]